MVFILVYCSQPPVVQHASHNGVADTQTFELETVLKYSCIPGKTVFFAFLYHVIMLLNYPVGYLIVGFAHAKCFLYNTTAQWFGPDVTCKREWSLRDTFL